MRSVVRSTFTVAAAASLALVVMAGAPLSATASTPTASPGPVSDAPPTASSGASPGVTTVRNCADAKPGFAACFAERRTDAGAHPNAAASPDATPSGYGPTQLKSAYNIPTTLGSGKTVAIVDAYNDPTAASDLATYRSTYGLPACTVASGCFKQVSQTGSTTSLPTTDTGWAGEIALDIDMVSAACPACNILLVEASSANDSDLDTAVNYAAAHANVVSNSYGGSESSTDTSDTAYTHSGVPILASSGDEGYVVEFPAANPHVIAVGGTSLKTASNTRGWTESVWNTSNSEGAGSGCSKYETKPTWQTDTGCTKRTVADVSAVADPATGVAVYDTTGGSGWNVYGGTSVASPLVSAMVAESGNTTGGAYLYAHTSNFNDVTTGQTSSTCSSYLCKAQAGYDGPTGLGTPNGTAGLGPNSSGGTTPTNDFSVSDSPSSGSVTAGSSTSSAIATATTAGSAQTVSLSVSGAPTGVTTSLSPTSVTSGSGSTLTVTTTTAAAAGTYTLTVTGTASSGSHTATYSLTVKSPTGSCTTQSQLLANPGFESGATAWTQTSGVIDGSTSGSAPRTGTYKAWLDGYGTTHTDTLSQTVTIPAGACSASFSFWLKITTAETTTSTAYDKLTTTVGSTTLATYSNLNAGTAYVQKTFDLSAYKGQSVTLKFTGVEDSSLQTSFFVDDTALTVTQ